MSVVENAKGHLLSSGSWSVDPAHSTVEFRVKHMVIKTVAGRFREFEGSIVAGGEPSVDGTIGVHAAGMQFNGDGRHFALSGELTIKGVTRPITLGGELAGAVLGADGRER